MWPWGRQVRAGLWAGDTGKSWCPKAIGGTVLSREPHFSLLSFNWWTRPTHAEALTISFTQSGPISVLISSEKYLPGHIWNNVCGCRGPTQCAHEINHPRGDDDTLFSPLTIVTTIPITMAVPWGQGISFFASTERPGSGA